jgi:hypothetical protein
MNEVKKTTLKDRIRAAVRAFQGKPKDTFDLGVRVHRCDQCKRGDCETCAYKREFTELMELPNCNDCELNGRKSCNVSPLPGETVRINCPLHRPKKEAES